MSYQEYSKAALAAALAEERAIYETYKGQGLKLDLSRGKPSKEQLDLSIPMLEIALWEDKDGTDCRNYGGLFGLSRMRTFWSEVTDIPYDNVIAGGNSSLAMIYDALSRAMMYGNVNSPRPWCLEPVKKWLCPAPGYDRHFNMTELMGFELIYIPMTDEGPDMDEVEKWICDPTVKGIWCVPKYANPTGITYSDDVVRRIAKMKPAAPDFMVIWDNAYAVHDFLEDGDPLLDIFPEAEKWGNEDNIYYFSSTSKITFAGSGVAMMALSPRNIAHMTPYYGARTIGPDKLNQLRHLYFMPNADVLREQMKSHARVIAPRFELLLTTLERELGDKGIATWTNPKGGYFVSLDVMEGCAKRVYQLCKEAGVVLTTVGATFPYGNDPWDSNLRLAPTFCSLEELAPAASILACSIKLAALEKLLEQ